MFPTKKSINESLQDFYAKMGWRIPVPASSPRKDRRKSNILRNFFPAHGALDSRVGYRFNEQGRLEKLIDGKPTGEEIMCNEKVSAIHGTDSREPYHLDVDREIRALEQVSKSLDSLLSKIRGTPTSIDNGIKDASDSTPSLTEVLHSGSARIQDQRNAMLDLINQIESEIF